MLNGTKDQGFSQAPRANIIGIINNNLNKIIMGNTVGIIVGNYAGNVVGILAGSTPRNKS